MWSMHAVSEEDRLDREGARRVLRRTVRLAAPYRRTIDALCRKSASPSLSEIELTTDLPCTHFRPASMTDHLELSTITGTRAISGSVAM